MTNYHVQENLRFYQSCYDFDRNRDAAINPPLPPPLVPQEQIITWPGETPAGKIRTPTALVQRQFNLMRIHPHEGDDLGVFSNVIAYIYSTTTNPEPQAVIDKVSNVLNELYTRIDRLEMEKRVLQLSLEETEEGLDMERRRNTRSQYYYP